MVYELFFSYYDQNPENDEEMIIPFLPIDMHIFYDVQI